MSEDTYCVICGCSNIRPLHLSYYYKNINNKKIKKDTRFQIIDNYIKKYGEKKLLNFIKDTKWLDKQSMLLCDNTIIHNIKEYNSHGIFISKNKFKSKYNYYK